MAWQAPESTIGMGNALLVTGSDDVYVANSVTLISTGGGGITFSGTSQDIVVHGTVAGLAGLAGFHADHTTITVGATGIVSGLGGRAIELGGTFLSLRNAGLIESAGAFVPTVLLEGDSGFETHKVDNAGTIRGYVGIELGSDLSAFELVNAGTLSGADKAFLDRAASADKIVNTGTIKGSVDLGGGDDLFDSRKGVVIDAMIEGGSGQDRLFTGSGAQNLYGEAGFDTLMGGAGADLLVGGADADTASYASAAAGVTASLANASANTGDAKGDTYIGVEQLLGSKFADKLFGNEGANQLAGGAGADSLTGGAGADRFVFVTAPGGSASADRITDFQADFDELRLDDASFAGLALGNLSLAAFRAGASGAAQDGTDRVLYETDTGWLRWDADGNGAGAAVQFAKLGAGLALGADDFFVI